MDVLIAQPVLETARLTLRPHQKSDTGLISLYTSDLRVARMTASIPHPNPPGAVEAFMASVAKSNDASMSWTIDATRGYGCEVVGAISIDADGSLGYWLGPFFWNLIRPPVGFWKRTALWWIMRALSFAWLKTRPFKPGR